jgi:tRNA(fMet)-specific endonuclease VapC
LMAYLIDSDWLIDYITDQPAGIQLLEDLAHEEISVSIITYMEVYEGIERASNALEFAERFEAVLLDIPLLTISRQVARRCAQLRHSLRSQGRRVHRRAMDLLIAATALEHSLTLVTRNVEDYRDIRGLQIYPGT